jgi:hypothetical protein
VNKNAFAYVNGVQTSTQVVTWLPDDIILNSIRAFAISITSPNGYSTTNGALPNNAGGIPPTGRYLAPACTGNHINYLQGMCGFNNLIIHGPGFFKFDVGLNKKFYIGERFNIEARANFLNALNYTAFRVGGFGGDTVGSGCCGAAFGQMALGSAYRDNNTTNDPGGRVIDLQLRVSF